MFLNSIPGVGHIKGLLHYATGDVEEGNKAMCEATRTTVVIGAGVAGSVAGPAGAALGAAAGGVFMDSVTSIATNEPQGIYENIDNIVTDVQKGNVPIASTLETGLTVGTDLLTGLGAGALVSSVSKSAGSSAGKTVIKSAGKAAAKTFTKNTLKKEATRQLVIVGAATTAAVIVTASPGSSQRPPWSGGGGGGGGCGGGSSSGNKSNSNGSGQSSNNNSSQSTGRSGNSGTQTDSNKTNNSSNTKKPNSNTTTSSGSGSQPPKNNKDAPKKECKLKLTSILAKLLEIFGVESLDDICIEGNYIFRGLSAGQKNFLKTRLQNLNRQGYNIEHVIKIIVRIFKQICTDSADINYKNFLSLMEFVATFVGEQVDRLNDLYNDDERNLDDIVYLDVFRELSIGERLQRLAEIVTRNSLSPSRLAVLAEVAVERIVSIFRNIQAQIAGIVMNPGFRNIFSAVYHYYKHRRVPLQNRELTVSEYFDMIKNLLLDVFRMGDYARLQRGEIPDLQLEVNVPGLGTVKIVLKYQNGKVVIASVFIH